jgi:AraC family transcriptional regulator
MTPARKCPPGSYRAPQTLTATIAGGRYAVLGFEGTVVHVVEAWTRLLRDWLPSSGLQLDGRHCYEYYPPGVRDAEHAGVFRCDICIPVAPL